MICVSSPGDIGMGGPLRERAIERDSCAHYFKRILARLGSFLRLHVLRASELLPNRKKHRNR